MNRVVGVDTLRAVCALWVVIDHIGNPPLLAGIDNTKAICRVANGLYDNFWNGPAAVIVFFVISGFCIHFPFAKSLSIPSLAEYGIRRYLRIGVPLIVAMLLSPLVGLKLELFHDSILWSLLAELVYYSLYPIFLLMRRRGISWELMWGIAFALGLLLVVRNPTARTYPSFGVALNWLMGLSCWLAGCSVAEKFSNRSWAPFGNIQLWRLGVWGISVILSILRFHSPIGYPWTLNLFAILVAFWLIQEIENCRTRRPNLWLEQLGLWSYSMYLMHLPASFFFSYMDLPNFGYLPNWILRLAVILIVSYLFYWIVEYPSHIVARKLGKLVRSWCISKSDLTS